MKEGRVKVGKGEVAGDRHTADPSILGARILQRKYNSFLLTMKRVVRATAKKMRTAGVRKTRRVRKERTKKVLSFFVSKTTPIFGYLSYLASSWPVSCGEGKKELE